MDTVAVSEFSGYFVAAIVGGMFIGACLSAGSIIKILAYVRRYYSNRFWTPAEADRKRIEAALHAEMRAKDDYIEHLSKLLRRARRQQEIPALIAEQLHGENVTPMFHRRQAE